MTLTRAVRLVWLVVVLSGAVLVLEGCADRCNLFSRGWPLCGI